MDQYNRIEQQFYRPFTCARASGTLALVSFGRTIKKRRETLGLTLEQLAERANLSPNYIGTVENGRRDPSLSTVLALAKGLRIPAGELLGPVKGLSPEGYDVGRQYDAAAEDVQDLVARLLRLAGRRRR